MANLNVNIPTTFEETVTAPHITGLETPTQPTDAANKQYVDAAVSGGGGVTFLGDGGTNTAHFFAFDLGSAVMLVGRFLSASFEPNAEFTVGIDLGVQPYSFDAMIPMTFYSTSNQSAGTIFTLMGTGSNTYLRCTANTTNFNGNGCFTAIFVK